MNNKKTKYILIISAITLIIAVIFSIFLLNHNKRERDLVNIRTTHISGSGTQVDPVKIYTETGWKQFYQKYRNKSTTVYAELSFGNNKPHENIDYQAFSYKELPQFINTGNSSTDSVISENEHPFMNGLVLDGKYKEIEVTWSIEENEILAPSFSAGLLPVLGGNCTIKNLKVSGSIDITSEHVVTAGALIGAVVPAPGYTKEPIINIENCYVSVDITLKGSTPGYAGGLIGFACDYNYGTINVTDTVSCGSVSGPTKHDIVCIADLDSYGGANPIKTANSYYGGKDDGAEPAGLIDAYNSTDGSIYVKGNWTKSLAYMSEYKLNPNISWLKNYSKISPYTVYWKIMTSNNKILHNKEQIGYIMGRSEHSDWKCGNGSLDLYNFGVLDRSLSYSTHTGGRTFVEAKGKADGKNYEITIIVEPVPLTLTFKANVYTNISSDLEYKISENDVINIVVKDLKQGFQSVTYTFTDYDTKSSRTVQCSANLQYYITKITINNSTINKNTVLTINDPATFSVTTTIKQYDIIIT